MLSCFDQGTSQITRIFLLCPFILSVFVGCSHFSNAVIYPSGWPLKYITAPARSQKAKVGHDITNYSSSDGGYTGVWKKSDNGRIYIVGFSCKASWEDVKRHFAKCVERYEDWELTSESNDTVSYTINEDGKEYFVAVVKVDLGTDNYFIHLEE